MRTVAYLYADNVDPRLPAGVTTLYIDANQPQCLVGEVLYHMGNTVTRLKALDRDGPEGGLNPSGSIRFLDNADPLIQRIDRHGQRLLDHLQHRQERYGWVPWSVAVGQVLDLDQHDQYWATRNLLRVAMWRREPARLYAQSLEQ
jgi:hypothetical protein